MNPIEEVIENLGSIGDWRIETADGVCVESTIANFLDAVQTAGFQSIIEPVVICYDYMEVLHVNQGVYTLNDHFRKAWAMGYMGLTWSFEHQHYVYENSHLSDEVMHGREL